jgi:hypothetical protein
VFAVGDSRSPNRARSSASISAPTKAKAEEIAVARYGRPIVVERFIVPSSPVLHLGEYRRRDG